MLSVQFGQIELSHAATPAKNPGGKAPLSRSTVFAQVTAPNAGLSWQPEENVKEYLAASWVAALKEDLGMYLLHVCSVFVPCNSTIGPCALFALALSMQYV